MKWVGILVAVALLLTLAAGGAFLTWRDRQETQAAARNFAQVLEPAKQPVAQPEAPQPTRASPPRPSRGFAALLNAMAGEARDFSADSQALDARFRAIDLSGVLAPGNLTSAEGIAGSRAKVKAMSALILERKRMVQSYTRRMESLLRDAPVADDEKRRALESFAEKKPRTMSAFRELEHAQKTIIGRTSAILDFAKQNLGAAVLRHGKLQFKAKAQLDQYNLLLEQLRRAASAEETAMAKMAAVQEQSRRDAEVALASLAN